MGHTPTPWRIEEGTTGIWGACNPDDQSSYGMGYPVTDARITPVSMSSWCKGPYADEGEANARRIVAAVNGTSTLSTEALEAGVVDKLVEAASVAVEELDYIAEFAMRQTEWTGDDDAALLAVKNLRAALALARGEQA